MQFALIRIHFNNVKLPIKELLKIILIFKTWTLPNYTNLFFAAEEYKTRKWIHRTATCHPSRNVWACYKFNNSRSFKWNENERIFI